MDSLPLSQNHTFSSNTLTQLPYNSNSLHPSHLPSSHTHPLNASLDFPLCAYQASLELLRRSHILQQLPVWLQDNPDLIKLLSSQSPIINSDPTIQSLLNSVTSLVGQPNPTSLQDPWIVIHVTLKLLNINTFLHLPQITLNCCGTNYSCSQSLQYTKLKFSHVPVIKPLTCPRCRESKPPLITYTPSSFFLRIIDYKRNGHFNKIIAPHFQNYRVKSIIQFCSERLHFRTISYSKNKVECFDNNSTQIFPLNNNLLDQKGWQTYLILLTAFCWDQDG